MTPSPHRNLGPRILAMRLDGFGVYEIAARLQCAVSTVYYWVNHA